MLLTKTEHAGSVYDQNTGLRKSQIGSKRGIMRFLAETGSKSHATICPQERAHRCGHFALLFDFIGAKLRKLLHWYVEKLFQKVQQRMFCEIS